MRSVSIRTRPIKISWHERLSFPERHHMANQILARPQGHLLDLPPLIFSNGRVVELIEQKWATLPAEYVQDQDLYDDLADFTCRFFLQWIDPPSRLSF